MGSSQDLHIGTISGRSEDFANNVDIVSDMNILNGLSSDDTNVSATNISLTAGEGKDIGSSDRYFVVSTASEKAGEGLKYKTEQAYIKGVGEVLNINDGTSVGNALIESNNVIANNLTSETGSIDISADATAELNNVSVNKDLNITASDVKVKDLQAKGNFNAVADNLSVGSSQDLHIGTISGRSEDFANNVDIVSDSDVKIQDINTETLSLTTKTSNVSMTGDIKGKGIIKTADKKIVIGDIKDASDHNATAQLVLIKKPMHLTLGKGNIIETDAQNVIRHDKSVFINKRQHGVSIEDKIQFEIGTLIRNKFYSVFDNKVTYPYLKGHHDYITELINQNNITNQYNDVIDDYNVLAVINQKK